MNCLYNSEEQKNTDVWCLMMSVWIKVITASFHSKSCPRSEPPYPILNIVLQTKPDDQNDQDDQDHKDDQDDLDDQDYQDDKEDQSD